MEKFAKRLFGLFVVLLALLTACIAPLAGARTVGAEGGNTHAPTPEAPPEEEPKFDTLYYISDYSLSEQYCMNFVNDEFIVDYHLDYWAMSQDFYNEFAIFMAEERYRDISDCYFIFEIRNGMPFEIDDGSNELFPDQLLTLFSALKENNCKTMFICGTQETRFENKNEFLDCVDIHVSTALYDTFLSSIFYYAIQDCGTEMLSYCSFFLDQNFSWGVEEYDIDNPYQTNDFLRVYLIPFFRNVYVDEIRENQWTNTQLLQEKNIKIICRLNEGYYDVVNHQYIDSYVDYYGAQNFYEQYLYNDHVYAIGFANTEGWADYILNFKNTILETNNQIVSVYFYADNKYGNKEEQIYSSGLLKDAYYILKAFLTDQDLSVYDNLVGECIVTHTLIPVSENGWMVLGFGNSGWDLYMKEDPTADDYNSFLYYFMYYNKF